MAKWDRNTPWRQGHLLTTETVAAFGLNGGDPPENVAVVVISHDCDLAQPAAVEPSVEVIVGRFIYAANGNFTNCKNLRCLHVTCCAGETVRIVELYANKRRTLPKDSPDAKQATLSDHAPSAEIQMSATERNTLQIWLAARYRRAAFPDEFDRRLRQTGVAERLAKIFKSSGPHVSAVFFDVDKGIERIRNGPDDPYELIVTLLYSTDTDADEAEEEATKTARAVNAIFELRCQAEKSGARVWQWIELVDIEVVSDRALSYADSLHLKKWQADHISLRADPPHPIFEG